MHLNIKNINEQQIFHFSLISGSDYGNFVIIEEKEKCNWKTDKPLNSDQKL